MAGARDAAGVVAIATGGESAYGTSDTRTHLLYVNAADAAAALAPRLFDTSTLATGNEEGIGNVIVAWDTPVSLSGPVCDKSLPILLSFALGNCTRSAVDTASASQFAIVPATSQVENSSTTLEFKHTTITDTSTNPGRSMVLSGVKVDNFTLSGDKDSGIWTWSADCITAGINETAATDVSSLTAPQYLPFHFGGTQFVVSSAQTTAPVADAPVSGVGATGGWSSGADLGPYIESVSYNIGNGHSTNHAYSTNGSAYRANRGKRVQTITARFLFDDSVATLRAFLTHGGSAAGGEADYSLCLHSYQTPLISGASTFHWGFGGYFPKLSIVSVSKPSGSPRMFDVTFRVYNNNAGEHSSYWYTWGDVDESDYL